MLRTPRSAFGADLIEGKEQAPTVDNGIGESGTQRDGGFFVQTFHDVVVTPVVFWDGLEMLGERAPVDGNGSGSIGALEEELSSLDVERMRRVVTPVSGEGGDPPVEGVLLHGLRDGAPVVALCAYNG